MGFALLLFMKGFMVYKILISIFIFFIPICASAEEITVAAAANVQYTLEELKAEFEKNSDIKIKTIIGSSGKLTAQIENGAPFDIFLSADVEYPQTLYKENLALEAPKIYAYGRLVLWTMKDIDLSQGVQILNKNFVKKIAIANSQTAPYGREAVNAMKYYKLYNDVERKLVYAQSISQVNQFITTQAADVGFTAKSVVLANNMKDQGKWIEVAEDAYQPIAQGVVILKNTQKNNLKNAQAFYDFLFTMKAQEIFKKYGYILP